ncbi:MAG TPA: hypothetical protein VKE74_19640 [Gemmataceae bacterium]|nr:hypothetical protein [Gemmataceae bacterium]
MGNRREGRPRGGRSWRAGLGTDSLALSYALARRLDVIQYRADHAKHPLLFDAERVRNAELVRDADAAVIVWDAFDGLLRDLVMKCKAKRISVPVLGVGSGDGGGDPPANGSVRTARTSAAVTRMPAPHCP